MNHLELVDAPNRRVINTRCRPAPQQKMLDWLGKPDIVRSKCPLPTVTKSVGPFRATGFEPFLDVLAKGFAVLKEHYPDLYEMLESAGCLNVRRVRSGVNYSNHAWGCAIDIQIAGHLCPLGSEKIHSGLIKVYQAFKQYALVSGNWLYWGAGFARCDAMHFEASEELLRKWKDQGVI